MGFGLQRTHASKVQGNPHSILPKGNITPSSMCQGTQPAKLKTGGQQSLHAVVQEGLLVQGIGEKDMAEDTGGGGLVLVEK